MKRHTLIPAPAGLAVLLMVLALPSSIASAQNIRYVAVSGTDAGACISQGSPCETVSYALAQASAGDTIEIDEGVYTELAGLNIDKSITLRGAGQTQPVGTSIRAHRLPGMASSRVITIDGEFEVSISDLAIQNGVAEGFGDDAYGGGIYAVNATLTLTRVTLRYNQAPTMQAAGGQLHPHGLGGGLCIGNSALTLSQVEFTGNMASESGGGLFLSNSSDRPVALTDVAFDGNSTLLPEQSTFGGEGGGMYSNNSSPTINNVVFTNNFAGEKGGGLFTRFGSPTLVDVRFDDNQAGDLGIPGHGGGMYIEFDGQPSLTRVEFHNNYAHRAGGGLYLHDSSALLKSVSFIDNVAINCGGAMSSSLSTPVVINGLFSGNLSTQDGGAICNDRSLVTITNSTIAGNHAKGFGGGLYNFQTAPSLANSIVWGNHADDIGNEMYLSVQGSFETVSISHSLYDNHPNDIILDVQGGAIDFDEVNVLHDNPLFIDAPNDNLRLSDPSPAIDAGDPDTDLSLFPGGPDNPEDIDNSSRVHGRRIDMGAYEWSSINDMIFHDRFEDF